MSIRKQIIDSLKQKFKKHTAPAKKYAADLIPKVNIANAQNVSTNFMKTQEHIDNYSSTLTKILNQEVELGNEIVETSKGWPDEKTILIFLKKPFMAKYTFENVEYRNVDDPHYWKAEYVDHSTKHVLACGF